MEGHCIIAVSLLLGLTVALLEESLVAFEPTDDASDPLGVQIATNSLASDLDEITGVRRPVLEWKQSPGFDIETTDLSISGLAIITATIDSQLISEIERRNGITFNDIRGKWETFRTVLFENPLPGVRHGLVIIGSDKRGTMFGVYPLAEQAGKSPLHWWADVPVTHHDRIYALNRTTTHGEPSVKYRGIFINDEASALTSWWAKRSNTTDFTFNAEFYRHVFDLLVRLKANYMWPAMWGSFIPTPGRIFFTDDPRNQQLADDYGIVVSTSHAEPMQRAYIEWKENPAWGEWDFINNKENVTRFMEEGVKRAGTNETYFTLGMRGADDSPIQADDPIATLREVMTYYAAGPEPPDDVTLIFSDDNWGNVQRLPTAKERQRSGGIGLYYHFDYVGRPKSWKWQNCNNLVNRIWVINVGDIKPVELPLSFAVDLAWDVSRFDFDMIPSYLETLAARDFGLEFSKELSSARLTGLRNSEMIEPTTYSILDFREAETVLNDWKRLADEAWSIERALPEGRRDALYHLLTYPAVAGYNYYQILLGQGRDRQYSFERRNSANLVAQQVLELANGKWEGIMSTPKYDMGVADWRSSSRDVVANLSYVQLRQDFDYAFGNHGIFVEQSLSAYRQARICGSINPSLPTEEGFSPVMPPMDPYSPESRITSGTVSKAHPEERLEVSVDWSAVPTSFDEPVQLRVEWEPSPPYFEYIHVPVRNRRVPEDFPGFPESAGTRSRSGSIALRPYTQARESEDAAREAWVEYDFYLFNLASPFNPTIYINGALDTDPNLPMKISLSLDGGASNFTRLLGEPDEPGDTPQGWSGSVADHVWKKDIGFGLLESGKHTLRWQVNSPELYLEKIALSLEGQLDSYLGHPETRLMQRC
ncbi:hypothetical protein BDW66DRAFT_159759 [Aspergillus desertorum]